MSGPSQAELEASARVNTNCESQQAGRVGCANEAGPA